MPITPAEFDQANHPVPVPGTLMTAAASGSVAGTIIPVAAGAGAGSSVALATGDVATDSAGVFQLTAAGSPAAGVVATINLVNPFTAQNIPVSVCNITDTTASPNTTLAASLIPVVTSGQVTSLNVVAAAMTTAHVYQVEYEVLAA